MLPCAKNLLDSGHQIYGIVATDKSLIAPQAGQLDRWADLHHIPQLTAATDLFSFLSGQQFDYLFSLSNSTILSREILALPRQFAINCHDGPLPKYGGMNAPAWALIDGERRHGITWHQIAARVDAGDILKQVFFAIEARETAATLNSKCYQAIISSFPELIAELASGNISPIEQNLQERSYFLSSQKPSPGCILDWQQSAQSLDSIVRALDFDRQENSIGLPKIAIGSQLAIVTQVEISSDRSMAPPGTIVALSVDGLQVSTTSEDLLVRQILTLEGKPLDFLALCSGRVGDERSLQISSELNHQIERLEIGLAKHERFWAQRLATLIPLVLPDGDRRHHSRSTLEFQHVPIAPALIAFLTDRQPTWQVADFLTVAIATYLSRIAQQDYFDLNVKFSELDRQLAGMPNLFATEVPCRIDLTQSQTFEAAFVTIARELELVRDRQTYARDLVLRYPELPAAIQIEDRMPVRITRVETLDRHRAPLAEVTMPGLTFVIPDRGDEWRCDYDRSLIDPEQIARMLERLSVFIGGIIDRVDRWRSLSERESLASLPLLPATEVDRLLNEWNDTRVDFGDERCIHQLIEAQVAQTPDRIAVECAGAQLTYRELNNRANRLAIDLIALGVRADVLVGICVERSLDTIVGILGILKAGGAYVPLDPAYPQSRLSLIIEDAAMSIVVTQSRLVAKLPAYSGQIVCIDELDRYPERHFLHAITDVKPHHLAYVIYTSGSTGKPKGVAIEHHSLVNYALATKFTYALTSADRVLQFTSLNFDVSAEEIYPCLSVGATLVMRNEATSGSIDNFLQHCRDWRITVTSLPTAFWHELTTRLAVDKLPLPPSWRLAIIGGEKAAPAKLQAWIALGLKVRLIDAYGPTEATISALMCDVASCAPHTPATIAIGRPIANIQAYVLDKNMALCPIGSPGELYLGGAGLARGYLNDPELTAQKFIANPFNPTGSARLYRTGDLVKYLPDGKLQFLDRLDEQVKIRGFRVELGEIEAVLARHPGIKDAIATASSSGHQQSLCAYIILNSHPDTSLAGTESHSDISSNIRIYLSSQLPDYMVPHRLTIVSTWPLTPNGKVDRQALLALNTATTSSSGTTAPRNTLERVLIDIWQEVLELKHIDINDNFFELGGHSLLAIQLFTKIHQRLKVQLPLSILVQSPTVLQLANHLNSSARANISSSLVPIQPHGSKAPFFCVHSLDPCLLFYQSLVKFLDPDQPFYGIQPYDLDNKLLAFTTIEEIAADYLWEIRAIQPHGPYYLGGFSFGGYIAFEMAQQLHKQGEKVAILAIFDTPALGLNYDVSASAQLDNIWRLFCKYGNRFIYDKVINQVILYRNRTRNIWQKLQGLVHTDRLKLTSAQQHWYRAYAMNERALEDYQPDLYPGKITLFKAGYSVSTIALEAGWQDLAQMGVDTIEIPGDHVSIFTNTNAAYLARELNKCIQASLSLEPLDIHQALQLEPTHEKILYPI